MSPKYFKAAIFLIFCCLISCKKWPTNHNKLRVAVTLSSGETIFIEESDSNVRMFCSGSGVTIENRGQQPFLSLATLDYGCFNGPGTYSGYHFQCSFKIDTGMLSPKYTNSGVSDPGNLTFTALSEKYVECTFLATCKYGANDSVKIRGTFKGDFVGY
jgi:hypothetical protein